jgi:hypothetical protein
MPDLVEVLDEALGRVRRLIDEHYLVGSRRSGVFAVPSVFIVDNHPLPSLRGTIIVQPTTPVELQSFDVD